MLLLALAECSRFRSIAAAGAAENFRSGETTAAAATRDNNSRREILGIVESDVCQALVCSVIVATESRGSSTRTLCASTLTGKVLGIIRSG